MALSYVEYTSAGDTQNFNVTFPYLDKGHVSVRVNGVVVAFTWLSSTAITVTPIIYTDSVVRVSRSTPQTPLANSSDGAVPTHTILQTRTKQAVYVAQEIQDNANESLATAEASLHAAQYAAAASTGALPFVNVLDFGAVGDGTTDDTAAFDAALLDGRPIYLDSTFSYNITDLRILNTTTCPGIFCFGGYARLITGATTDVRMILVQKPENFTFWGLQFEHPVWTDPTNVPTHGRAIEFSPTGTIGDNYLIENCRFINGTAAISMIGCIITNSRIARNYVTGTWGDGISVNCVKNFEIVDNVLEDSGYATGLHQPAGAIRCGASTQLDSSLNVHISRNTIARCNLASGQSAIDCYSGSARSIVVSENICEENGSGIEMKTSQWTVVGPPDVYQANVIRNNHIRMLSSDYNTGITMFYATSGNIQGKAANNIVQDNFISCATRPAAGLTHYGITIGGQGHTTVTGNRLFDTCQGISITGLGASDLIVYDVLISDNTVDGSGPAIIHSGSTGVVDGLVIRDNPLLRSTGTAHAVSFSGAKTKNMDISGNRIESVTSSCIEIRDVEDSAITGNTLVSAQSCVISQGTAPSNVKILNNRFVTPVNGCNLAVGTGLDIRDNDMSEIGALYRPVVGAGTYTTLRNFRGYATSNPGTANANRGDYYVNSTPSAASYERWLAVATGSSAVIKGVGLIET